MRTVYHDAETPDPTHDHGRDIGQADEVVFNYGLQSSEGAPPPVKTSYGEDRYSVATEENDDLGLQAGEAVVVARSGNEHWNAGEDDEDFDHVGGEVGPREVRGDDNSTQVLVVVGLLALGLWLYSRSKQA